MRINKIVVMVLCGFVLIGQQVMVRHAQAGEVYKMGSIACLTGAVSQHGQYTTRGFKLALEDINRISFAKGGTMKTVVEDGQNVPRVALSCLNKLINIDNVPYFQTVGSSVVLACSPIAEKNKVVLMNTAATNPKIRQAGDYIFSLIPGTASESKAAAEFAYNMLKAKRGAILHVNDEYGNGAKNIFTDVFKKLGGDLVATEMYSAKDTDFRTQITKIRSLKPAVVYFAGHSNACGRAIKQARELGLTNRWIGTVATKSHVTLEVAGKAAEGLVATSFPYDPENGTAKMKAFGQRFKNRYGVVPTIYSATSYLSAILFAKAIWSGARTSTEIKDYLYTVKDWDSIIDRVTFDKDGMVDLPCRFLVVKNGKFVPYR